ncbi:MAG TPA: thiamine pyrophosphate-binding protein [Bacillota bacterium]|nr:thiamine pyrophosphate-binding protein [Bacillota bacterium]
MTIKYTVARAILEQLNHFEVEYIFGVTGDSIVGLLGELSTQSQIKFILTRHESAAGFMASTYAKLTGKLGVCVATSGPGMANLLNGLGDAYADQVPVLAITGQVPTTKIGTSSKQYIDQQRLIEPLAAYSAQLSSPTALVPLLQRAVQTAIKQKAVAHLSVPKDLFLQPYSGELIPPNPYLYKQLPSDLGNVLVAAHFLSKCKKPIILAGHGALGCHDEIVSLAHKLDAGIILSLGAKGLIPENNEYMLGGIGEGGSQEAAEIMQECDGLLIIGAMWYPKTFLSPNIPFVQIERELDHLQFDKNLHTALIGDAKKILGPLYERITATAKPEWKNRVHLVHNQWQHSVNEEASILSEPIDPAFIMKILSEEIPSTAVITLDTGDHTVWFNRSFTTKGQKVLFSGTWRTLGYALPAGICAGLIFPDKEIIVLAGDGGFTMNLGELSTLMMLHLPIKIVIFNNHCLAMEKNKMQYMGLKPYGVELVNPNFASLAEAYGIRGIRIEHPQNLRDGIRNMLQTKGPVLLEIISSTQATSLSKVKAVSSFSK